MTGRVDDPHALSVKLNRIAVLQQNISGRGGLLAFIEQAEAVFDAVAEHLVILAVYAHLRTGQLTQELQVFRMVKMSVRQENMGKLHIFFRQSVGYILKLCRRVDNSGAFAPAQQVAVRRHTVGRDFSYPHGFSFRGTLAVI